MICQNCARPAKVLTKQRCPACYQWQRTHGGQERPEKQWRRWSKQYTHKVPPPQNGHNSQPNDPPMPANWYLLGGNEAEALRELESAKHFTLMRNGRGKVWAVRRGDLGPNEINVVMR